MQNFAPIIIFTYNRLEHFRQTVSYLQQNSEAADSDLYIFSDGPRQDKDKVVVEAIRTYAGSIEGFRNVFLVAAEKNMGLKASVRNGISHVLSRHEAAIIVEDDICVNTRFLEFHNACLVKYRDNRELWSVSGFVIPEVGKDVMEQTGQSFYMTPRASSWGWSTWKDRWDKVVWDEAGLFGHLASNGNYGKYHKTGGDKVRMLLDCFEKKNDSWAIIWDYNHFMNGTFCLYPSRSFIRNIGLDNSGVHSKPRAEYDVELENWKFDATLLPDQPKSPDYVKHRFGRINRKLYRDVLDIFRFRRLKKKFK